MNKTHQLLISLLLVAQVFLGSFELGMGGIPWIIMSEVWSPDLQLISHDRNLHSTMQTKYIEWRGSSLQIFPINVKGSAGSLINLVSWVGSWFISYTFSYLFEWSTAGASLQNRSRCISFYAPLLLTVSLLRQCFRDILYIRGRLCGRCSVHRETCSRD